MSKAVKKRETVVELKRAVSPREAAHKVGWLTSLAAEGVLVDFPGNENGPILARTLLGLDAAVVRQAIEQRNGVLLAFEDGHPDRPIVLGVLAGAVLDASRALVSIEPPAQPVEDVLVDGRRVVIEGKEEIVLRCGEASITLRRNGRVVIRGTYVEAHSKGVNRIKGGSVQIN